LNILITGASSGIGEELAKRYSKDENRLFLVARSCEKLNALKKSLKNVETLCIDLSNLEEATRVGEELSSKNLDLIILNAGVSLGHNSQELPPLEDFTNLFNINFLSNHAVLQPLEKGLKERGGKIVFISSLASIFTMPTSIAYSSSKRALNSYADGLRLSLKPYGVEVVNILPGFIETPLTDKNRFKMPFLMSLKEGVDRIESGIDKGVHTLIFPKRFYIIIKLLSLLPLKLKSRLINRRLPSNG
jgi:short-subunit dehydrogenase